MLLYQQGGGLIITISIVIIHVWACVSV